MNAHVHVMQASTVFHCTPDGTDVLLGIQANYM